MRRLRCSPDRRTFAWLSLALAVMGPGPAAAAVALDRPTLRLIDMINRQVNREFVPRAPWPMDEEDGIWDCENYAQEKRARLIASGVPAEDLALWRVVTRGGKTHMVLVISTARGGLMLDNLSPWTTRTAKAGFYTHWAHLDGDPAARPD